jgi:excisionase family DNA binding protein
MQSRSLDTRKTITSYPLQVRIVQQYLVISSPEWNIQVSAGTLAPNALKEDMVHIQSIGSSVLKVFAEIQARMDEYQLQGKEFPRPQSPQCGERPSEKQKRLLTIRNVADVIGVSQGTIRKLVKQGLLRCQSTAGGHRRFSQEDIQAYLQRMQKL